MSDFIRIKDMVIAKDKIITVEPKKESNSLLIYLTSGDRFNAYYDNPRDLELALSNLYSKLGV